MPHSSRRWVGPLSLAVVLAGLAGVSSPAHADEGPATDPAAPTAPTAPTTPVEIPAYTTETTQVFALPDGRYQLVSHEQPVRVKQADSWVPLDTTLEQNSDGSWSPRASSVPLTLSGGGAGSLLSMGDDGAQVSMTWDSPLPTPTVDGASLTYAGVRPGIDLVMTAQPRGYSQVLVVHDEQAADDLVADPATITLDGDGLALTRSADGAVNAANDDVTFTGAPPMQWDSSGLSGGEGSAADSGTAEVREVAATYDHVDADTLQVSVAPSAETMSDPSTTYPIYVDPNMSEAGQPHTLTVHAGGWNYYDSTTEPLRVGYCGWSFCTSAQGASRSFFSFDISALTGTSADPHIDNAVVRAYQLWNASSGATPVNLTKAGHFDRDTTYPGLVGAQLQQVSSAAGAGGNNEAWIAFQNAAVDQYVSDTVKNEGGVIRFSLSAPDANDKYQWKKFGNTDGSDPTITITFAFAPTTPAGLTVEDAVDCPGEVTRTADRSLGLMARSTDQNPTPLNTRHHFELWKDDTGDGLDTATDTRWRFNTTQSSETNVPSGGLAKFHSTWSNSSNTAPVTDGGYFARDRAHSEPTYGTPQYSAWSGWKILIVDGTPPGTPTLTSNDYPSDQWGASLDSPGTFQATSSIDSAGFSYAYDNASVPVVTGCDYSLAKSATTGYVPASGGKATITAPSGLAQGVRHTLTVRAFDKTHLMSAGSATYSFYVPLSVPGVSASAAFATFPKFRYEPELSAVSNTVTEGSSLLSTISDASDSGGQEVVITPSTTPNPPSAEEPAVVSYNLPAPVPGYYALGIDFNKRPDGGQVAFRIKDAPLTDAESAPITADTYAAARIGSYVSLGGVSVAAPPPGERPSIKLSILVTGRNAASSGYAVSIDKLHLVPLRRAAFTSLSAAFDNKGIGVDGSSAARLTANDDRSLSRSALSAVGLTPGGINTNGGTGVVGGVSFTMPPAITQEKTGQVVDNVVSAGQEITMPAGTPVPFHTEADGTKVPGHVNLLVAATCGRISPKAIDKTHALSIRYTDGQPDPQDAVLDDQVTTIPDWLEARDETIPGLTFDRFLDGTATVTSPQPTLYVARFPLHRDYVDSGYSIKTITLPRIGTDLRNTCSSPALHVFAMTLTDD